MLDYRNSCSRVQNGNVSALIVAVCTLRPGSQISSRVWHAALDGFSDLGKQAGGGDSACRFAALLSELAIADSRVLPLACGRYDSQTAAILTRSVALGREGWQTPDLNATSQLRMCSSRFQAPKPLV